MGLLSAIYSFALTGRQLIYTSLKKPKKLPTKVISIGNLTLGGTGKTPAVIAVAEEAKKRGFKPCILTRGYKGKAKSPCFVSEGEGPLLNAHRAGDEPILMAEKLRGIPVVVGRNRYNSGIFTIQNLQSPISNLQSPILFILDDGFQHWALHRDIDILLIDATNPFGNGKLFPEGILREPFKAMRRAHIVVMTKTDMVCSELVKAINLRIKQHNPDAALYMSFHKPTALVDTLGEIKNVDLLKHTPIYAFTGIANPSHFKTLLVSKGADIVKFKTFRDHYIYKQRDINKIKKDAAGLEIITTEKDFVKLKDLELPENISALRIEFTVKDAFYNHIFDILLKRMSDDID